MGKVSKKVNMNKPVILLFATFLILSCGKKGPLKPPFDIAPIGQPSSAIILPPPPKITGYHIDSLKGAVIINFSGESCNKFKIYRYKKESKKSKKTFFISQTTNFVDEFPVLNTAMIYEISCVINDVESENNPTEEITFR